jgi:hypothetical protein
MLHERNHPLYASAAMVTMLVAMDYPSLVAFALGLILLAAGPAQLKVTDRAVTLIVWVSSYELMIRGRRRR